MLKPDFPKKGMGKEKKKKRKEEKGRKKKKKMKIKKRTIKKKEREGFPIKRSKGSKNGKESIINQWKRENGRSSDQINFRQGK